jgi:erythromycin esterase-like protein
MWANWEGVALAEWLREYNEGLAPERQIGFYGLDVYSLWESLEEVTRYLEDVDAEAAQLARQAYICFQPYDRDVQAYAWATRLVPISCEADVMKLLLEIQRKREQHQHYPGDGEATFNAEQNATVAVVAERYYRAMIQGGPDSWNVRDHHMADTLERLMRYHGTEAKGIVWEHNTHIGDAQATDMVGAGMVNVGQLVRQQHSDDGVVLVGFGSHHGSVIAGRAWDAPMERMNVPDAREDSYEALFHRTLGDNRLMILTDTIGEISEVFRRTRGHRAIGVVYNPEYERMGNYVPTSLSRRYDAFIYLDETEALHPLHLEAEPSEEPPETYPWAV